MLTGELKSKVTDGPGPVTAILHVDEGSRRLVYMASGREPTQADPYPLRSFF